MVLKFICCDRWLFLAWFHRFAMVWYSSSLCYSCLLRRPIFMTGTVWWKAARKLHHLDSFGLSWPPVLRKHVMQLLTSATEYIYIYIYVWKNMKNMFLLRCICFTIVWWDIPKQHTLDFQIPVEEVSGKWQPYRNLLRWYLAIEGIRLGSDKKLPISRLAKPAATRQSRFTTTRGNGRNNLSVSATERDGFCFPTYWHCKKWTRMILKMS